MGVQKPSIPQGTRDFGPEVMLRRNLIIESIKSVFKKFGFMPLETPSMEKIEVLTGKYGDEGDRLIYKILDSGDPFSKVDTETLSSGNTSKISPKVVSRALRYDLTVPFARFVTMHRNDITFPFKRFQVQPVWRADRPQRGRYREFFQCDADIVGTDSLLCEAECMAMVDSAMALLGIPYTLKVNNRKVLSAIAQIAGVKKEEDLFVALDKLDKIGKEKVVEEMKSKGVDDSSIESIEPVFGIEGSLNERIETIEKLVGTTEIGKEGVEELKKAIKLAGEFVDDLDSKIELDITLARGLTYYTGAIFEIKANNVQIGSIGGGGRYDNLTGVFGMPDISGIGISFGIDRIYDVMSESNLFNEDTEITTQVMLVNFSESLYPTTLKVLNELRSGDISAELYPSSAKMKKQMNYADKKSIPFVLILGDEEQAKGICQIRNMTSGHQIEVPINDIVSKIKELV